ncbi:DegV family protein [Desulforamulus ruminis]|uniref:DegV family protein n=1 Tax=Desulforamulus ruminis TaxID=1564 RepID=UPI0023538676|nr:DegV family protein [Desulforamulus ruminis]
MQKVAIVTDSTCDLDSDVLDHYNIKVIPLKVIYPQEEYLDRVNITPQQVYDRMPSETPTTSLPALADIMATYDKLRKEHFTHIISIHISSGLSGTFNAVTTAAREFRDMVIEVIDSKALSLGLGIPVLEAAKTLKERLGFEAAVERAREIIGKMEIYYVLSTLDYLRKGGRIGYVAGTLGEMLQVKPIISINKEGKYYTYDKVRGRKKSILRLLKIISDKLNHKKADVAVLHGGAEEEALELLQKVKKLTNVQEVHFGQIGPVMGVHTGPGLIGVCICTK